MRALPVILACFSAGLASAQVAWRDTLAVRMHELNIVLARADTLSMDEVMEDDWRINNALGESLTSVLNVPGLSDHDLDSLFPAGYIQKVRSTDGRLWIFNWDERSGGSFQGNLHVLLYRTARGEGRSFASFTLEGDEWSRGAYYSAIHPLRSKDGSALYVCIGSVRGCTTCCAEVVTVLELAEDGINFSYPAFNIPEKPADGEVQQQHSASTWALDARCGDIVSFAYDPKTQIVRYTYVPDDLTPVTSEAQNDEVSGRLRFDGRAFVAE
ncbi:MAG: hypothetical protein WAU70_12580 [Flavobacteriales bacterium]